MTGKLTATSELEPILARWKGLRPLPDLTSDEQIAFAEELSTVTLWLHSDRLASELAGDGVSAVDDLLFSLGRTLLRLGDPSSAAEVLERLAGALADAGHALRTVRTLDSLGTAFAELERFDRAEEAYRRAISVQARIDPGSAKLVPLENNLAACLAQDGRLDEAEHFFSESFRILRAATDADLSGVIGGFGERVTKNDLIGTRLHNLGELELERSRRDEGAGSTRRSLDAAAGRLREALSYFDHAEFALATRGLLAEIAVGDGRGAEADSELAALEATALGDPSLHRHLPAIYRRRALASRAVGASADALRHCRRSLTTSLGHADRAEERAIVDTFLETLGEGQAADREDVASPPGAVRVARRFRERHGEVIDDLLGFLERKDWYTGRSHSKSVANVSRKLGEAILAADASSAVDLEVLELAALLHDIGKLRVPWALLNKILPVRREERDILKSHAIESWKMLRTMRLEPLAEIAGEHHERLDGRGYPFGKSEPSLMGNIVAFADAFEAMTTVNRRWRPAKRKQEALVELTGLTGKWFYREVSMGAIAALG